MKVGYRVRNVLGAAVVSVVSMGSSPEASTEESPHICTGYEFVLITIIMLEKFCGAKVGSFDDGLISSLKECFNSTAESRTEAIDILNRMRRGNYEGLAFTEDYINKSFEEFKRASDEDPCAKVPRG